MSQNFDFWTNVGSFGGAFLGNLKFNFIHKIDKQCCSCLKFCLEWKEFNGCPKTKREKKKSFLLVHIGLNLWKKRDIASKEGKENEGPWDKLLKVPLSLLWGGLAQARRQALLSVIAPKWSFYGWKWSQIVSPIPPQFAHSEIPHCCRFLHLNQAGNLSQNVEPMWYSLFSWAFFLP